MPEVVMVIILIGLALYVILGGADFGAAVWELLGGPGREHAHESMAPVWEANHVWLIFVLTVTWTAFPVAFGSIASTLCVPLFVAGLGIIVRGTAYALRTGGPSERQMSWIARASAVSSVLTPFMLGAAIGGIASGRVPVGNAAGNLFTSWFNPTSVVVGLVAVANCAYMAAVFLAGDAARRGDRPASEALRIRALASGTVSGVLAVAGLVVLRSDARALYDGLIGGSGTVGVVASVLAGVATMALVRARRYEPARLTSGLAVAAIIAGWALAQQPVLLPGLTVDQAAAPHDTLVSVLVAVAVGALVLFPSLAVLFRLALGGRLGYGPGEVARAGAGAGAAGAAGAAGGGAGAAPGARAAVLGAWREGLLGRAAIACFIAGLGLLNIADGSWAHAIGVVALLACVVLGFAAVLPTLLATSHDAR